jgi:hypothetical protein
MTILRLYAENGHYAGFWVQHRQWPNACARVASINGRCAGKLPDGAELRTDLDIAWESFDVRSGRPLQPAPRGAHDTSFVRIAEPAWYRPRCETRGARPRSYSC